MKSIYTSLCLPGLLTGLVLFSGARADAQMRVPRVSVGGGAGIALPLHGDFDFTPWAWEADLRVGLSPRVLVEAAVGEWRHNTTTAADHIPAPAYPDAIGHLEQTTTHAMRTMQVNLLAAATAGRVRVTAGGGVGLLRHLRTVTTVAENCSGAATCGTFHSDVSSTTASAQAVGGMDVDVARFIAVYGQARFVVPLTDPGGSDLRVTAGVRLTLG